MPIVQFKDNCGKPNWNVFRAKNATILKVMYFYIYYKYYGINISYILNKINILKQSLFIAISFKVIEQSEAQRYGGGEMYR